MKMKRKKGISYTKGITYALTACIAVGLFSSVLSGAMKAKAKDDNTPNVTAYATAEQLKDNANFALSASYKGTAKKVAFGQDGSGNTQYWYIAGADPRYTDKWGTCTAGRNTACKREVSNHSKYDL